MEIYIGNIPPEITIDELRFLYQSFGKINFIDIKNRCQPAFAFIHFVNEESAKNASYYTNGFQYKGYMLQVYAPGQTNPQPFDFQPAGRSSAKSGTFNCPKNTNEGDAKKVLLSLEPSTSKAAFDSGLMRKGTADTCSSSRSVPGNQSSLSTSERPRKHVPPSRIAFLQRRAAERKLELLNNKPIETLTPEDIEAINRAMQTLADKPKKSSEASTNVPKLQHLEEDSGVQSLQPEAKSPKPVKLMENCKDIANGKGSLSVPENQSSGPLSTAERSRKNLTPARRAFLQRRAATRKLKKLNDKPVETLTLEDIESINWALQTLADSTKQSFESSTNGPKRQHSEKDSDLQSLQPEAKRPKLSVKLMKNPRDIANGHLVRAIIDRNSNDGAISPERWEIIRKKLMVVFFKVLKDNPGDPPNCSDAGWFQSSVKLMTCHNKRSAFLLKKAIQLIDDIWDGASLDVVSIEEIPRRPRSTALVPDGLSSPTEILELLRCGNPNLPIQDWRIVKVSEPEDSFRRITVILTQESLAPLREMRGQLSYGFEKIVLHVYRGDDKGVKNQDSSVSGSNKKLQKTSG